MRVFYLRDAFGFPLAAVVSELTKDKHNVAYAFATWNPNDNFNKKRGREIAEGRLNIGKIDGMVPVEGNIKRSIVEQIASDTRARYDWDCQCGEPNHVVTSNTPKCKKCSRPFTSPMGSKKLLVPTRTHEAAKLWLKRRTPAPAPVAVKDGP